jgi:hypothetical protein
MTQDSIKPNPIRLTVVGNILSDCKAVVTSSADLIDSAIISGLTFFTTLGASSVAVVPIETSLTIAAISSAAQFFTVLAIKRGLIKPQVDSPT